MNSILRILLMLTAITARALAADPVELKQRWIAGKEYFVTLQMTQTSVFAIGPVNMEQKMTMTMDTSVAVRPHEDGRRKRLTMKYGRMAMDVTVNDQKLGFDSAKPKEGTDPLELGKAFGTILGKEFKLLTDERDQVVEFENYDEFTKEFGALGAPSGADLSKMFSREGLLDAIKQGSLQAFPERPVQPGDTWPFTNKITMPGVGSVSIKGTYTFKGMVDHTGVSCAEIVTDGAITMELNPEVEAGAGAGLAALRLKLSEGTLKGPVWFDPQLGMARDTDLVQSMTMSMKNPANPDGDFVIPMKQSIKAKLTRIEDLK